MLPGPITTQAVINPGPMRVYQGRGVVGESVMQMSCFYLGSASLCRNEMELEGRMPCDDRVSRGSYSYSGQVVLVIVLDFTRETLPPSRSTSTGEAPEYEHD